MNRRNHVKKNGVDKAPKGKIVSSNTMFTNILYTITHQTLRNKIGGTLSKRKVRSSFPEEETSSMSSL